MWESLSLICFFIFMVATMNIVGIFFNLDILKTMRSKRFMSKVEYTKDIKKLDIKFYSLLFMAAISFFGTVIFHSYI